MKGLAITAMFLVSMAAVAIAKPVPVSKLNSLEDLAPPPTQNDVDINSGPSGEREYFQAPPPFRRAACPAACKRQSSTRCNWPSSVASALIGAWEPSYGKIVVASDNAIAASGRKVNLWGATMLGTILIILLILALVGAFPRWGYSSGWGYGPSGIVGVILIVVLILALTGRV